MGTIRTLANTIRLGRYCWLGTPSIVNDAILIALANLPTSESEPSPIVMILDAGLHPVFPTKWRANCSAANRNPTFAQDALGSIVAIARPNVRWVTAFSAKGYPAVTQASCVKALYVTPNAITNAAVLVDPLRNQAKALPGCSWPKIEEASDKLAIIVDVESLDSCAVVFPSAPKQLRRDMDSTVTWSKYANAYLSAHQGYSARAEIIPF